MFSLFYRHIVLFSCTGRNREIKWLGPKPMRQINSFLGEVSPSGTSLVLINCSHNGPLEETVGQKEFGSYVHRSYILIQSYII
jgi:hypothetical protein